MNSVSDLTMVVAGILAGIMFLASWRALRDHSTLGGTALPISACSAILSFVGLCRLEDGWINTILLGYMALPIVLALLLLLLGFRRLCRTASIIRLRRQVKVALAYALFLPPR